MDYGPLGDVYGMDALNKVQSQNSNPNMNPDMTSDKQSVKNNLIGMISNPWDAMQSNYQNVKSDFTDPSRGGWGMQGIGQKVGDVQKLIGTDYLGNSWDKNTGMQTPKLTDEHLGEKDANGLRPINPAGFRHIDSKLPTMSLGDNSQFTMPTKANNLPFADLSQGMSAGGQAPDMSKPQQSGGSGADTAKSALSLLAMI